MQGQKAGFPDMKHEIVQLFAKGNLVCGRGVFSGTNTCLLYTSDAADERSSVDLGGRRIIKKKKSGGCQMTQVTSMIWYTSQRRHSQGTRA